MPIFNVWLEVTTLTKESIPVYAKTAEDAMAYLNATDEWKTSGACEGLFDEGATFRAVSVVQALHPKEAGIDVEEYCWGEDEMEAAEAFYDVGQPQYLSDDNDVIEAEYQSYYVKLLEARDKYLKALAE